VVVRDAEQAAAYRPILAAANLEGAAHLICDGDAEAPRAALVGVRTALRAPRQPWVLVMPVDQIAVMLGDLRTLADAARPGDGPTVFGAITRGATEEAPFWPFPASGRVPSEPKLKEPSLRATSGCGTF
jgi:molybdopterin-guanine dinucleotide biosynthesis protein A